jgi:hypothetical protein
MLFKSKRSAPLAGLAGGAVGPPARLLKRQRHMRRICFKEAAQCALRVAPCGWRCETSATEYSWIHLYMYTYICMYQYV